jgi:dephospho-CoA kinase
LCSTGEARIRRDQLQGRAFEIYSDAQRTTKSAYATAQVALQNKGDLSFTEKEIDALLPRTLRQDMGGDNED